MNTSISPAGHVPNGQPTKRNAPPPKKKAKAADPLFGPKKRAIFQPKAPAVKPQINGTSVPIIRPRLGHSPAPLGAPSPARASPAVDDRKKTSVFSDPKGATGATGFRDYKLVTTKRGLLVGLRHHVLQFARDTPTDIRDEKEFTRPVRLHRRDPRAVPVEQVAPEKPEDIKDEMEVEEKEDFNKRKEARRLEREANLAQVAPSLESGKKPTVIKKKTAQVHSRGYTIEERKKMQSNYEEKLPWHIDDFDNQHCYIGSNQTGSSSIHAALIYEGKGDPSNSCFRLLPIEKMYQFKAKKTYKTMTIEEAEDAMKKKGRDPQWMIERKEAHLKEAQQEQLARRSRAFFGTKDENAAGRGDEGADLDFNMEEDFADDEEGDGFFEKDEDEKLAENRIKEDQLNANIFGIKEETEYDKAEEKERREKEKKKLIGKGIKKALEKREKNFDHASDSDDPFGSTSDSDDTEAERQRLLAEKKVKGDPDGKRSGVSTGNNTPSGRKEKHPGTASDREAVMRKPPASKKLKRPGSPYISDASGTDASLAHKKMKNRHLSSTQPASSHSRPISPAVIPPIPSSSAPAGVIRRDSNGSQPDPAKPLKKRKSFAPGAGSEAEMASFSEGGAMSDSSRKQKRLKLNLSPKDISRPSSALQTPLGGSRAPSPRPAVPQAPTPVLEPDVSTYPTADEVYAAIPAAGITTSELSNMFRSRYRREDRSLHMTAKIREVARFDKAMRLLFPSETFKAK